jgi:hypothetical protein
LEFVSQGAAWHPKDLDLFQKVDRFAKEFINDPPTLAFYVSCWAVMVDGEVVGLSGVRNVPDIHIRVKPHAKAYPAMKELIERVRSFLEDNGFHGQEVFVHKSALETEEQACPNWDKFLELYEAKPADRYTVTV